MRQPPADIYQHHLDRVSRAVMSCDVETVLSLAHLPLEMRTRDAALTARDPHDFATGFVDFGRYLRQIGANDYIRLCLGAAFEPGSDRTAINGSHRSYVLGSGQYLVDPFPGSMTLRLVEGIWQCTKIFDDVLNHRCTILSPALLRGTDRDFEASAC